MHEILARADTSTWRYYGYNPSFTLPIVCTVLFFVAFVAHVVYMARTRSWYMWPFCLGALGETVGYIFRRLSAAHPTGRKEGLLYYIIQSLFIILAPACMAATHLVFGRLITYVGEKYSPVRARRVTLIFVVFDVISFLVQGGGGSLYSSDNTGLYHIAKAILIVGFLVQIISFGIFAIFAGIYQVRAKRAGEREGKWTLCLYTLYIGTALILTRGIFRTIEFGSGGSGNTGYLLTREAWYYGLETLPILICTYFFLLSHPSRYIPSDRSVRLHPELSGNGMDMSGAGSDMDKEVFEEGRKKRWWRRCSEAVYQKRKSGIRTGKRLEEAKVLYGVKKEAEELEESLNQVQKLHKLQQYGTEDNLAGTELERVLAASVLSCVSRFASSPLKDIDTKGLLAAFEKASYRSTDMEPMDQVSFHALLAAAARMSDSPLLLGGREDLRKWGSRREDACRVLKAQLVAMVDAVGVWRKASTASVSVLSLLEWLTECEEAQAAHEDTLTRQFADTCSSHILELVEDSGRSTTEAELKAKLGTIGYIRDMWAAAGFGRRPRFTTSDIPFMPGQSPAPLAEALQEEQLRQAGFITTLPAPQKRFFSLLIAFVFHLASVARKIGDTLTGKQARAERLLDESAARHTLAELNHAGTAIPVLAAACDFMSDSKGQEEARVMISHLAVFRLSLIFILYRTVKSRLEQQHQAHVGADEAAYWFRLQNTYASVRAAALSSSLEAVGLIMRKTESHGFAIWGAETLFVRLMAIDVIIDTPATEDGGDPALGYTCQVKLTALQNILKILYTVGWAFERLARPTARVQMEIEALSRRQEARGDRFGPSTYSAPAPTLLTWHPSQPTFTPAEGYDLWAGNGSADPFFADHYHFPDAATTVEGQPTAWSQFAGEAAMWDGGGSYT
ncbi:RTA-like protein [Pseudohyphozyma bogoriensis]|nr:RTA-like protein [Pseudohyphozyma bogoriensis]